MREALHLSINAVTCPNMLLFTPTNARETVNMNNNNICLLIGNVLSLLQRNVPNPSLLVAWTEILGPQRPDDFGKCLDAPRLALCSAPKMANRKLATLVTYPARGKSNNISHP